MGNIAEAIDTDEMVRAELRYLVDDGALVEWRELELPFGERWILDTGAVVTRPLTGAQVWSFLHGYHVGRRTQVRVPAYSSNTPSVGVTA